MSNKFKAAIEIIGVNPFVFVPDKKLQLIFKESKRNKGPIPVYGTVNGIPFKQTLVRCLGHWRLYINTGMLKNSPKRNGEMIEIEIKFDPVSREIKQPALFENALLANKKAKEAFEKLTASRKNEIVRYLANLKKEETLNRNIQKVIAYLSGKEKFAGRDYSPTKK
ncbi:MAG: YdeI/OmpD-associated family protein [Bacteroidetes bacterium]|nr:YdeI/OmpD-associated family protein [Bacteroidota bacterium]